MSDNGFVKLRRGLDEHLARMSDGAVKLYIRLLFLADWRKGKTQGLAQVVFSEIAAEFGWSPRTVKYITAELKEGGYIAVERRGNQHRPSIIRIEKYDGARAKDCLSTGEQGQESKGVGATNCPSTCPSTLVTPNEIRCPAPAKKYKERRSSSKNGAAETKMFDPDDRLFAPIGKRWERLGIRKLSERFRPFVEIVDRTQPKPEETIGTWCGRIIDLCQNADVEYAPEFYAVTRRFRKNDKPYFSVQEQIAEENRRRMQL
jgi:hypothetical protein